MTSIVPGVNRSDVRPAQDEDESLPTLQAVCEERDFWRSERWKAQEQLRQMADWRRDAITALANVMRMSWDSDVMPEETGERIRTALGKVTL